MPKLRTPPEDSVNLRPALNAIRQVMVECRLYDKAMDALALAFSHGQGAITEEEFSAKLESLRAQREQSEAKIKISLRALVGNAMKRAHRVG